MEEQTTTDAPAPEPTGDEKSSQPAEVQPAEAATPAEPNTNSNQEPSEDDNSKWLESKGIDPTTEEGQAKLVKNAKEAEKQFTQKRQTESQLEKVVSQNTSAQSNVESELLSEVRTMKADRVERQFYDSNPAAKELQGTINEQLSSDPVVAELINAGYLEEAMKTAYGSALVESQSDRASTLKQEGGQEALKKLANKQRSTAVAASATSPVSNQKVTRENAGEYWNGLSPSERSDPANQAILEQALSN